MLRSLVLAGTAALSFGMTAAAQKRETPLSQVAVPHSYYWREMYVPQVTSGPSAFAWSPDGNEVVFSMQGTIWRQRIGTTTAIQLTSGNTYDYQPDWSPDGRSIVFSAYDGRSIALTLLDLPTGERRTLIGDGAVNVEPRWSPDGTRIAFVSTLFNRRWHVFVLSRSAAKNPLFNEPLRITEDNDSNLPRYYYSRWDHYISPTWSPDGNELVLVSNRGHIHGTGGFWRMEARSGAPLREIRYEETTWKARPDWSPDGTRIVYSSYLGRQWNQLWIMPSEGGDPFPLTYGDFDATAPRWSRDGKRIAFVSAVWPEFSEKPFKESDALNKKRIDERDKSLVKVRTFAPVLPPLGRVRRGQAAAPVRPPGGVPQGRLAPLRVQGRRLRLP